MNTVSVLIRIAAFLFVLCLVCLDAPTQVTQLGEVRVDGETYTAAEVTKVEPDGLVITHSSGIARIPYEKLPQDLQKTFQFDPAQAQAHRSKKTELGKATRQAAQTPPEKKREAVAIDLSQPYGVSIETEESPKVIPAPSEHCMEFGSARPADEGVDEEKLYELAKYIRDERKLPIFSLLISRNGKIIFELYTGKIDPDASHYLMSVTKSMLSTLIGVAIDRGILPPEDKPLSQVLPDEAFKNKKQQAKFNTINLVNVMEMSALNAPDPPRDKSSRAAARGARFFTSKNRLEFALEEDLLKSPGLEHQYNDCTPALASGTLSYASGKSAFDFAREYLFEPLDFRNAEWMHQDETGIDMGGYGLRLRPIDMHKWGVLFLNNGLWEGKRIISEGWVSKTAAPTMAAGSREPNYGWFWWRQNYGTPLVFQEANGWKGQRLAINRDKRIVVSMTACIEGDKEHEFFAKIMRDYVVPSIDPPSGPKKTDALGSELLNLRKSKPRYSSLMEERMVPSVEPKEKRRLFKL
jgi:CubicO group peptidase (beta-lactamase class C family)